MYEKKELFRAQFQAQERVAVQVQGGYTTTSLPRLQSSWNRLEIVGEDSRQCLNTTCSAEDG